MADTQEEKREERRKRMLSEPLMPLLIRTALHTTSDYLLGNEEKGDINTDYPKIVRLVASNTDSMTKEQKKEIMSILLGDD